MNSSLQKLLLLGICIEFLIFLGAYIIHTEIEQVFRYAARYSGRFSALLFLYTFYLFTKRPLDLKNNIVARNLITVFAVLHVIHFIFLAMSVYLNKIPLEIIKVIGGSLAYLLIVIAPFRLHKLKFNKQLIYFYYVSLVMILTYVARIKGDFQGAEPYWLHYVMLGVFVISSVVFSIKMRLSINKNMY